MFLCPFQLVVAIDTNFQVHKIHATLTTIAPSIFHYFYRGSQILNILPDLSVTQATQSINNCPPPSRIFHGRQTILADIHQYFTQDTGKQHIYVLYGLGGSGKTQIALKFIDESASKFSDIFLIDTSTPETIDTGLKRIAATKQIGDTAQDALDWLRSKKNEWLLFFDNADDPKIDLHNFFPRCKHGNILITSRNPELRGYGSHSLVSDMEEIEAVELLLRSSAQYITPENIDTATEIVKVSKILFIYPLSSFWQALWYLPLAIVQAGAFILKSGSLNSYLALYAKNKEQLLRQKPAQSHDDYAWTVYTTWQISFGKLSQTAAMMLQLCSFLHHGGISEQIFKNASLYSFPTFGHLNKSCRSWSNSCPIF
ncbi:P-loop containing nucleoside triphosphate hydrolase protein [Mycena latifolia]|nr:P-loop containing nucleoside triphosphate hydrolase protein [Mycena latifolia]